MKKNVVFWIGVKNEQYSEKYGGWEWMDISRKSWEYWCKRNDVLFVPFEEPVEKDLTRFRINWQKAIFCFDELERRNIDYDQIFLVDCACMMKWDAPNVFELTEHKFVGWPARDNLRWMNDSIQGYKSFFNNFELDIWDYISSGVIIFNKSHKKIMNGFKKLYLENVDTFIDLQDNIVRKGTEQTPLNYWLKMNNVDMKLDLPKAFCLTHMHRGGWFNYNWQLNNDKMPHFIKYGYNWVFSGFPKNERTQVMKQTWNLVKDNYNLKNNNILDDTKHRDTAKYTTSRKMKNDLLNEFSDEKNKEKVVVELGAAQGHSTRLLSHIFKKVISVDNSDYNLEKAIKNNSDKDNIEFVKMDLYNDRWEDYLPKDVDVVMIDANHTYPAVKRDIDNCLELFGKDVIFIFDDYGLPCVTGGPRRAIDEYVDNGILKIDKFIGEKPEDLVHAGGTKFTDMEGCICTAGAKAWFEEEAKNE